MLEFHNERHGTDLTLEELKEFHENSDGRFECSNAEKLLEL